MASKQIFKVHEHYLVKTVDCDAIRTLIKEFFECLGHKFSPKCKIETGDSEIEANDISDIEPYLTQDYKSLTIYGFGESGSNAGIHFVVRPKKKNVNEVTLMIETADKGLLDAFRKRAIRELGLYKERKSKALPERPKSEREKRPLHNVFLAHSFDDKDEELARDFLELIGLLGFTCTTGRTPKLKEISKKIKESIGGSDLVVALMTKDRKISSGKWSTSEWVRSEADYALGAGKAVLQIVEKGVYMRTGITGDVERIMFQRSKLHKAFLLTIEVLTSGID